MQPKPPGPSTPAPLCRICQGALGAPAVRLAAMPLTDEFIQPTEPGKAEFLHDIHIHECPHCGIVQNPVDFNYGAYYRDYQYSSGHSDFTQGFMRRYAAAALDAFAAANGRGAHRVLEVGSGDGAQLRCFSDAGLPTVLGIEPSEYLAQVANAQGIATEVALFDTGLLTRNLGSFDICLSSYTFDHVRNPGEYLAVANAMLVPGGVLAIEVHDLQKIIERAEFCLFEHEHTIYLTAADIQRLVEAAGFKVVAINPLPAQGVRGNSLIVLAVKTQATPFAAPASAGAHSELPALQGRIASLTQRLDQWIDGLPADARLVGFGAGGRGVMTLAGLQRHGRVEALFDSNYQSHTHLTPKTRIPVVGPLDWASYAQAHCLVFSFGYFAEIQASLVAAGFARERIHSLLDFY